jgi:crotonobetainyl-CoA:carnitine CoA-transferase CaiB-like acyl-CoA transferase
MAQVFADPQVVHSGQVVTVEHPTLGPLKLVGPALSLSATPPTVSAPPPLVGQHTDEIMRMLSIPVADPDVP